MSSENVRTTVLLVNLDEDADRLSIIVDALKSETEFDVVRVPAVAGKELPEQARITLAGDVGWAAMRGEIGCFLSHLKAWEIVANSRGAYSIVLEDDAVISNIGRIVGAKIPDDAELVFVNDRMCLGSRNDDREIDIKFIPVTDILHKIAVKGGGVGADGYLLTAAGAKKLINAVANDLFYGHVDWRLLRYSLGQDFWLNRNIEPDLKFVIENHHNPSIPPMWNVVKSYCLNTPLVHFGTVPSSRLRMNE